MVTREFLDSDRVNFLIWRYLLEGNYRETAAKFQKEWHVKEPHRQFTFAPHVKGHALVSAINRGLIYYALEREHAQNQLPEDARTDSGFLQNGIFGPLDAPQQQRIEDGDEAALAEDINELSRKRGLQLVNGSPTKRPRLNNGYENGIEHTTESTSMEVDQPDVPENEHEDDNNKQAYPSPLEGERASSPFPRTDGPEQGTQVDKVDELSPNTTFIRLMDDTSPRNDGSATGGDVISAQSPSSAAGAENAPILLQCEWNPKDPSVLAAAGTDALARVWTISHTTAPPEPGSDHVSPHARTLLDPDASKSTTVTALAWTSDGKVIAIATEESPTMAGTINLWSVDGGHLQSMEVSEPPVVKLLWNSTNTALLALSPDKTGVLVTVYYAPAGNSCSYVLSGVDMATTPPDATWTSENEFLLCGGRTLICLRCSDTSCELVRKFETNESDSFSSVLFDRRANLAATASDKGVLDLWDESGARRSISAHTGAITTMAWQPLPPDDTSNSDERLIATGGDDCAILIWNARQPEAKPLSFLTMDLPIYKLAFTPDGAFIAGATSSQVLIWKVGSYGVPRASWTRPAHAGWLSPKAASESDEEDEHCLCWDASGQKLAYGSNSRLAVINFTR